MSGLPPIHRSVRVPLNQAAAFDLFMRRLPDWWPLAQRSVAMDEALSCHVEPCVGGRLYERTRGGVEHLWGRILVWDEPSRSVFTWHPGLAEAAATEVEVTFIAGDNETRVEVEHRDWDRLGAHASFVRGLYEGGWLNALARFAALADGATELPDPPPAAPCVPC
jgi:hypothetical protein